MIRHWLTAALLASTNVWAANHEIDNQRSVITIHVSKAGLLSAFGHDHEITTRISGGHIQYPENPSVELWVDARALRVVDPEASAKDRAEVQTRMEGPDVLDVRRFPEIHFRSIAVEQRGKDRWTVRGNLDLHGQSRPGVLDIAEAGGWFVGTATLKIRDYGITPPVVAGGSVKVKDEIKLDFKVITGQASSLATQSSARAH
jgi:polyisoprenoid-binding protein YceI